jgi:hypothetical protein
VAKLDGLSNYRQSVVLSVSFTCLLNSKVKQTEVAIIVLTCFMLQVQPSITFISFPLLSVVMSNDNRGLASADEEPARIITGTGTPAEEKEEERARKSKK